VLLPQALGPESRVSTKFFLAFNVPEAELAPAAGKEAGQGAQAASWEDLQVGACWVSAVWSWPCVAGVVVLGL
jgi:hypothetical protein